MNLLNQIQEIRQGRKSGSARQRGGWLGFTVLEMMVVITIIFVLLSIAIPNYRTSIVGGGSIVHSAATTTTTNRLALTLTDSLWVDATSRIDATNRGYLPG